MVNSISNAGSFVKPAINPLALNPSIVGCGSLESLHSSHDLHGSFDDISEYSLGDLSTYAPPEKIENKEALFGIKPNRYPFGKEAYFEYLLTEVNREGKPPLLLRPLAALLALFGIHGFGQTNCASCATAVIDTFENNKLYLAQSDLRGAKIAGNMSKKVNEGLSQEEFLNNLSNYKENDEFHYVIAINRPNWWSIFPWVKSGHACNMSKFKDNDTIHFFDTQKRTYTSFDLRDTPAWCTDIKNFLGSVGAGGIDVWKKVGCNTQIISRNNSSGLFNQLIPELGFFSFCCRFHDNRKCVCFQ